MTTSELVFCHSFPEGTVPTTLTVTALLHQWKWRIESLTLQGFVLLYALSYCIDKKNPLNQVVSVLLQPEWALWDASETSGRAKSLTETWQPCESKNRTYSNQCCWRSIHYPVYIILGRKEMRVEMNKTEMTLMCENVVFKFFSPHSDLHSWILKRVLMWWVWSVEASGGCFVRSDQIHQAWVPAYRSPPGYTGVCEQCSCTTDHPQVIASQGVSMVFFWMKWQ